MLTNALNSDSFFGVFLALKSTRTLPIDVQGRRDALQEGGATELKRRRSPFLKVSTKPSFPSTMTGTAKNEARKRAEKRAGRELRLEYALTEWYDQDSKPREEWVSAREIAKKFGVAPSTLNDHINKKHALQTIYLGKRQKVPPKAEEEVVQWIIDMDCAGMPPSFEDIHRVLTYVLNRGHRNGTQTVSVSMVKRFLVRNASRINSRWSSPLDKNRADGLNEITTEQHFSLVKETGEKYDIIPQNDYGFDESPIILGIAPKQRVYGRRVNKGGKRVKQSYQRRDGNRESLTIGEFICGDGTKGDPMIILRGKTLKKEWGGKENNPINAM
jgi:hypothetical protein